jgi:O-antigen/teichoic acid export membrane protein
VVSKARGLDGAGRRARSVVGEGLTRKGTHWLLGGALVGGFAAYLFQLVGTRALGHDAYAPIGTLWTIQYLCWSIFLSSIESYVTREVFVGRVGGTLLRATAARIWMWIGGLAAILTAGCWLVRDRLFYGVGDLAVVAGLTLLSFGGLAVVRGRLAGEERFGAFGLLSAAESLVRVALAVGIVLIAPTARALAWALPVGAAAAAGSWFALESRRKDSLSARAATPEPSRLGRFLMLNSVSNGAVHLLLAGGPLALVVLSARPEEVSIFFVTITAARVPVVFALGGVLSRLLPSFTRVLDSRGPEALPSLARRLALGTVLIAAVGAATGAAVGSQLIAFLFGAGFEPPSWLAAAAAGAALLATGGMVLNQLLVAGGLEQRLPLPWIGGIAVALASILLVAGTPSWRTAVACVVGELAAIVGLVIAARSSDSSRPPTTKGDLGAAVAN